MSQIQDQLENLPGYDVVMDMFNDYAGEHFNNLNPYEDKQGNKVKLRSRFSTDKERRLWKRVQSRAWTHDKCFMGSCGVGMDCGLGLAPLVALIFPSIGPLLMYLVHNRLIHAAASQLNMPNKLVAQLETQVFVDLLITFPPVIGSFFSWLNGCSTRNAAIIYKYMAFLADEREKNRMPTYMGPRSNQPQSRSQSQPPIQSAPLAALAPTYQNAWNPTKTARSSGTGGIVVGTQQQSGFR